MTRRALVVGALALAAVPPARADAAVTVGTFSFVPPPGVQESSPPPASAWDWWGADPDEGALDLAVRAGLPSPSPREVLALALAPGSTGLISGFAVESVRGVDTIRGATAELASLTVGGVSGGPQRRAAVLAVVGGGAGALFWLVGSDVSPAVVSNLISSVRVGAS